MGLFAKRSTSGGPPCGTARAVGPQAGDSYFGKSITITGNISGDDPVTLHGKLDGEIRLKGRLVVGTQAHIEGVVRAESIAAGGRIDGEVTVADALHLESNASLSGRVATAKLSVEEGAVFNGELKMGTQQRGKKDP